MVRVPQVEIGSTNKMVLKVYTVRGELGNARAGWLRRQKTIKASSVADAKARAKALWEKPFYHGDHVRFIWVKEGVVGMRESIKLDRQHGRSMEKVFDL